MRNNIVDIIRGFAMLLVVLGHTLSGTVSEYSDSLLFQAIWTLQMPLFIVISGYVTRYSSPLKDTNALWKFIKKRTLAYMLPWAVWSFVVRGLIFGQTYFWDFQYLFWHMDSGYWFLVTIWTISIIYGIADLISNKWCKDKISNVIIHLSVCCVGMVGLSIIGYFADFSFFSIKLTLYYLPIYLLGYIYGQLQDWLLQRANAKIIINGIVLVSLGIWLAVINRYNFYESGDGAVMIVFRFCTSILGCVFVIGLFTADYNLWGKILHWTGTHSLEVYLSHYLFLRLVPAQSLTGLATLEGFLSLSINFVLTVVLTILMVRLIESNSILNFLLYAKRK